LVSGGLDSIGRILSSYALKVKATSQIGAADRFWSPAPGHEHSRFVPHEALEADVQGDAQRQRAGKAGAGKVHDAVRDQAASLEGGAEEAVE
jgi:hypothetical protein